MTQSQNDESLIQMNFFERWKQQAKTLKRQTLALYFAYRDARTPWYAKGFAALVVAYAFSPIDLIPDFIPVLGYLDDVILVPLGIAIVLRLIPAEVMQDSQQKADALSKEDRPVNRFAGAIIVVIWILLAAMGVVFLARIFGG